MTEKDTCMAYTKSGNPCKGRPLPGSHFCFAHQPEEEKQPEEPQILVPEKEPEPEPAPEGEVCGHVNLHAYTDGNRLKCHLPKGHDGVHQCTHTRRDYKDGRLAYEEEGALTHWTDEAGIPPDQIKPDLDELEQALVEKELRELIRARVNR